MTFTDNFARADQDLETSADWTRIGGSAGDADIQSEKVHSTTIASTAAAYTCPDQGSGDRYVQGDLVDLNEDHFPIALRVQDGSNFVGLRNKGGRLELFKRVGGTFGSLADPICSCVVGDTIRLEMVGNDFEIFKNGVSQGTGSTTDLAGETGIGLIPRRDAVGMVDNFEAGLLAGGGGVAPQLMKRRTNTLLRM